MFKEKNPQKQIKRLASLNGLDFLSKNLKFAKTSRDFFSRIEKEINWFYKNFSSRRKLDVWLLYFTALIDLLKLTGIKSILKKLGLRKGEEKRILGHCGNRHRFIAALSKKGIKPARVFSLLSPLSYEEAVLLRASSADKFLRQHIKDFLEIYNDIKVLVSGHDLAGLGLVPGPDYKKIFSKVLEAKLNAEVKSHQDEMSLIKKLIEKKRS